LKYRNRRLVAAHVAGVLARRLADRAEDVDVVTWAPTSGQRRRRRGFDQAELIARAVAAHLGLPCRRLLERDGAAVAQTGRSRTQRLDGPCFRVHPRAAGRRVLVIDDVVTTGDTLESAGQWLRRGGAAGVILAAVAATPDCLLPQQRVA
jgi:predicted amidophosphoribosyltransferase